MLSWYTAILNAKMSARNQTTFGHVLEKENQSQRPSSLRQALPVFGRHPKEGKNLLLVLPLKQPSFIQFSHKIQSSATPLLLKDG